YTTLFRSAGRPRTGRQGSDADGCGGSEMVTLEMALEHLRLTPGEGSPDPVSQDVQTKLTAARAIVLDYIDRPDEDFDDDVVVDAAILWQLGELYRWRGDDDSAPPDREPGQLAPMVRALLARRRDPVVSAGEE